MSDKRCTKIIKIALLLLVSLEILAIFYCTDVFTTIQYQIRTKPAIEFIDSDSTFIYDELTQEILANPIYRKFDIIPAKKRKNVTILIIVSSGPKRHDRRQAIRETYWTQCKPTNKVTPECIFMTDCQKPTDQFYNVTRNESLTFGDIRFQNLTGGISFGIRYLYHIVWSTLNYNFDYVLRADDDYFFCLDRFLHELPTPMVKGFHWGWVHCIDAITRPEESMILFSYDVIQTFLSQNSKTMKCHPWADQMIGVWSNELNMRRLFRHDSRLHHTPIVSEEPSLREISNICEQYIGIHGTYPPDMRLFWKNRGNYNVTSNLLDQSPICESKHKFDWRMFKYEWNYEPKVCINNPTWNTTKQTVLGGSYAGRQGQ